MKPDPKKVARIFLAQKGADWMDLYVAPYPRALVRYLPDELDVVWWRNGDMHEGDIVDFIEPTDSDAYADNAGYRVGRNQRVRADKVYLR